MGGFLLLLGFLMCGAVTMNALLGAHKRLARLWLGLCAGLAMMMWLPTLFAFQMGFTATAQLLGLGAAFVIALAAALAGRGKRRSRQWTDIPLWLLLALLVPLTLLSGYIQYTHTLRQVDGALYVGQSTYGDLCLHLGIATGLRNAACPPDYTILPGTLLGYPFLGDSMVTSMLLMGAPLAASFAVTGTLMMALVYLGFVLFAWEMTRGWGSVRRRSAAVALAFTLMFINGGLGFIYVLDDLFAGDTTSLKAIFTDLYKTPTNQPALNLRWVNVICDMMVPQRTLLTGWMMLLPALYLLIHLARAKTSVGLSVLLGVWAGMMPMVHTHSLLALALFSLAAAIHCVAVAPEGSRLRALGKFALYGVIAAALALPQLITWALPQTMHTSAENALPELFDRFTRLLKGTGDASAQSGYPRYRFNWSNNDVYHGRLVNGYVWFWVKNVGVIWLMMIPAALALHRNGQDDDKAWLSRSRRRMLGLGALLIYLLAEFIQFQPNEYDNNKLFYAAYMAMMPAMGMLLCEIWQRLQNKRLRAALTALFLVTATLSGALSIAREALSNEYQLFSAAQVEAARFIEENTPQDAVILTADQHNNAPAALAGRRIVCGTSSYLYYHGVDYADALWDEQLMLEQPGSSAALFEAYGVQYAFISNYERHKYFVDEAWFRQNAKAVFTSSDVTIYALSRDEDADAPDSQQTLALPRAEDADAPD